MAVFRDMEEVSQGLLGLLNPNRAGARVRRLLGRQERMIERLLDTNKSTHRLLSEILAMEEDVAQKLIDEKETAQHVESKLQKFESELQKTSEKDASLQADLHLLTKELEELKEMEEDLTKTEGEVDEDTTVVIPSAMYISQLYHRVSKIEWDYECEPTVIKGIHHGPSIAQPIHFDSTQHSKKFISDYLWNLVDTQW
ncbi:kinetochore protein Spc24 isoform X1 [Trichosurus vulpecula]|uniref:kinetochore protein Spc24 isoform X1 n=2 Tax=Trichosurus vulpecula TaxID=9337 RepID=UPI00186ABE1D|nr:kinetochore protein Spc24 isoform X1 [Trichosurus vulpecula]